MSDQDKSPDWVAGYQARCREEVEAYLKIVESGHQVYDRVIRGLVEAPTFLERETARLAVLAEAHAAELHVGRPVLDVPGRAGCPVCMEAYAAAVGPGRCYARGHVQGHFGPFRGGCDIWFRKVDQGALVADLEALREDIKSFDNGRGEGAYFAEEIDRVLNDNRGPIPAHNGHYGVDSDQHSITTCPECIRVRAGGADLAEIRCEPGIVGGHVGCDHDPDRVHRSPDYVVPKTGAGCEFHAERGDGYVINCPACEAVVAGRVGGGE